MQHTDSTILHKRNMKIRSEVNSHNLLSDLLIHIEFRQGFMLFIKIPNLYAVLFDTFLPVR